ncbi:MAG: N-acetylneuraminate synthase [Verrucomicrobiota bacterium]
MSGKVTIIAEAGVNHNGDMALARQLIDAAALAGVDYVKFQTFKADDLVSPEARKADYQVANTGEEDETQYQMLRKLELSHDDHRSLISYCARQGVEFFSTAFDPAGLDFLHNLGFSFFKVPSGEITNYPYLEKLAAFGRPIVLSTGMATLEEVEQALAVLTGGSLTKDDITVLHCNTEYPTPMKDVNLKAMQTMSDALGVKVGYSDHTLGIEVPVAAVALGATVIEKHFTLDRKLPGPDHSASLEPGELVAMVKAIRHIELAISGDGVKQPSQSELGNLPIVRKSIHFARALPAGHVLVTEDLVMLSPGTGISPMQLKTFIGKELTDPVTLGQQLSIDQLK